MDSIQLAKDEEWTQIVDKSLKIATTLSSIKSRLQSSLTYLLLTHETKHATTQTTHPDPIVFPTLQRVKSSNQITQVDKYQFLQNRSKSPIDGNKQKPTQVLSSVSAVYNPKSSGSISPLRKQNLVRQAKALGYKYNTISERFQIGKFLGRGKFSDVFQAQ